MHCATGIRRVIKRTTIEGDRMPGHALTGE